MQDLKDIQCVEWKRVAEEAQKQLQLQSAQTTVLQVLMQNRADDAAKKSQEELVKVQLDIVNRLNERGNMNTRASQDMPDKHDSDEEQKRVADACPVVHACKDAQIRANLTVEEDATISRAVDCRDLQ